MPEAKCRICTMYFEYDASDTRPFLWHEHPDGSMVAIDNPNLKRQPRKWYPRQIFNKPPKKTFWQDWQHYETKIGIEE